MVSSRVWPRLARRNHDLPEGLSRGGGRWRRPGRGGPGEMGDRDILFFDATLDWLRTHHCVDERRVFVLGYSNGAGLASLLACERAGAIAGAAMAAGRPACSPGSSKPVIISHGIRIKRSDTSRPFRRRRYGARETGAPLRPKSVPQAASRPPPAPRRRPRCARIPAGTSTTRRSRARPPTSSKRCPSRKGVRPPYTIVRGSDPPLIPPA